MSRSGIRRTRLYTPPVLRHTLSLLLVLSLLAAACGGGADETTTTPPTTAAPATSAPPSTVVPTTLPPPSTTVTTSIDFTRASLLNGLPVEAGSTVDRRVIAVKIDNHVQARPQSGIQEADAMFETRVEGGLTRFIALFHDNDVEYLGPVRSARPTDGAVLAPLDAPFVISGAQPWVSKYIAGLGVDTIGEVTGTYRVRGRSAPHNLYANTEVLRETADARGFPDDPPPQWFTLGEIEGRPGVAGEVVLDWSDGTTVAWRYDGEQYLRWHDGQPHEWVDEDGNRGQISADVLVVLQGTLYTAYDPAGQGSGVPATETIGSGPAYVFAGGTVVEGTWARDSAEEQFVLTGADGQPMTVPVGMPWVSVFPLQRDVTWSPWQPEPAATTTTTGG